MKNSWTVPVTLSILNALFVQNIAVRAEENSNGAGVRVDAVELKKDNVQKKLDKLEKKLKKIRNELESSDRTAEKLREKLAEASLEIQGLEKENSFLRKKLIEISQKLNRRERELTDIRMVAGSLYNREVNPEKKEVLKVLEQLSSDTVALILDVADFVELVKTVSGKMGLSSLDEARINYRTDKLKNKAEILLSKLGKMDEGKRDNFKILAVSVKHNVAVIDGGFFDGLREGVALYAGKNEKLRIIMCRPYISAAIVEKGKLDALLPGMEAAFSRE